MQAPSGTQSAPPSSIPADQQPEHSSSVGTAEPEAELVDKVDGKAAQVATSGVASGLSTPETGEATGSGAPAGAAPAAAFDPAAFVAELGDAEKLTLAVWFRGAFPQVFGPLSGTVRDRAARKPSGGIGENERMFRPVSRVKRGGRYYPPGADVPLTRKEHAALKSAGVVAEDWPD
ncbi:hypothetical protein ACFSKM_27700 [Ancylobacter dichloromethanicus]|uniref:hypothetical protein n=1 Tax=Ancylobacter dichloromethanicus TaxID=518825 RepID=UPI003606A612